MSMLDENINDEMLDDIDEDLLPNKVKNESEENNYPNVVIKIEREQFSIFELNRRKEKGKIKLDPEFQRSTVWKPHQERELIESVIMGLPLQLIYTNSDEEGTHIIIDGKQRLNTFFRFLNNDFKLKDLKILKDLNGCYFRELEPMYQSKIEDFQLFFQVIKPPTPDKILFDIFDRVNRGGTTLNNQEMRNALYQGKSTKLLKELSENNYLKEMLGDNIQSRMKDRYLILRFLGFYIYFEDKDFLVEGQKYEYNGDIDEFLGHIMKYLNKLDDERIEKLKIDFEQAIKTIYSLQNKDAFRLPTQSNKRNPVNMALFETIIYFTHLYLRENRKYYLEYIMTLIGDQEFLESLSRNRDNKTKVEKRFSKIKNLLGSNI
ncbi:hypothetical protein FV113G1_22020 [Fusobacterium varium]|nr:hypothetical protein FV113G1_22020 [Fusobacterium varium]